MGPTGNTRIVQVHPTRKCNLSCKHCYSSSSPQATESIEPELLKNTIDDLAEQGYEWISFSGGEPLVYDPLPELLRHARSLELNTSMVSNGILLSGYRLEDIRNHLDALVISLDGKPASHNRMRNSARAFERMFRNLPNLQEHNMPFAFLFTLTQHNLDELPWVIDFSLRAKASGLLIHPLELCGSAASELEGQSPDSTEMAMAAALVNKIKASHQLPMNLELDLIHTQAFKDQPDLFFLGDYSYPLTGRLSDLLSVLVIEPDGEVVPLQYGFPRQYSLGNLHEKTISEMSDTWRDRVGPELHALSARLQARLTADNHSGGRLINWYEQMDRLARETCLVPVDTIKLAARSENKNIWPETCPESGPESNPESNPESSAENLSNISPDPDAELKSGPGSDGKLSPGLAHNREPDRQAVPNTTETLSVDLAS